MIKQFSEKAQMKVVIVEDENSAMYVIEHLITSLYPNIEIVGKSSSVIDAQLLMETVFFDLAIMDIQIEGGTSFDLLNNLNEIDFSIIFITANDSYALRAFEKDAIDYIVKPINSHDFKKAIDKAFRYLDINNLKSEMHRRLLVNNANELHALNYEDIIRFESDSNYTKSLFKFYSIKVL